MLADQKIALPSNTPELCYSAMLFSQLLLQSFESVL